MISKQELTLILNNCSNNDIDATPVNVQPNWTNILTSRTFYGVMIVKVCYGIVFDFVTQKGPAYLQDVIHLTVDQTGLVFSLIMFGYMVTLFAGGMLADVLFTKFTRLNTGNRVSDVKCFIRKSFESMSGLIMITTFLLIPLASEFQGTTICLMALAMIGYGFTSGGDLPLVADNSGPLSGTVFAILNTACSISGFAVPYIVGLVIQSDPKSIDNWGKIFETCSVFVLLGTLSFITMANAKQQTHWFISQVDEAKLPVSVNRLIKFKSAKSVQFTTSQTNHYRTFSF